MCLKFMRSQHIKSKGIESSLNLITDFSQTQHPSRSKTCSQGLAITCQHYAVEYCDVYLFIFTIKINLEVYMCFCNVPPSMLHILTSMC